MEKKNQKNRLCWGSRRGILELDLLLLPFVTEILPTLDEQACEEYRSLLESEDQSLYAWLLGIEMPPSHLLPAVERIRAHLCIESRQD